MAKNPEIEARKALFAKMKKEHYTLLIPDMCPIHFDLMSLLIQRRFGITPIVVTPLGREAKDAGLTAVHNDSCYPVIITCGAFLAELRKGNYDLNRTAVIISQTGGGCRASNYLSLFKKAFEKEFPTVPVISINFSGLSKDSSLPLSLGFIRELYQAVLYGDFLMNLEMQSRAYYPEEEVLSLTKECLEDLKKQVGHASFYKTTKNYRAILDRYMKFNPPAKRKPRVGIVGEIYVKYSPYANNHLCDYLFHAGVEPTLPSLNEFVLYCMKNYFIDNEYYGRNRLIMPFLHPFYKHCIKKTRKCAEMLKGTNFLPYSDFEEVVACGKKVIDLGVKMGEGWVIPAEMVDYATHGVENIVVVQPFGCLPNHIVGKGMIRPVKELCPNANIVPLDFDASSTSVNQENRLKLMLSNIQGE